ncbi:MAG: T9SS type A sorting domain-containing protein [Saprospiraceae bacterium]
MIRIIFILTIFLNVRYHNYGQDTFSKLFPYTDNETNFTSATIYDDTIYAVMTLSNGDLTELYKLDLKGNIIKKVEYHWLKTTTTRRTGSFRIIPDSNGDLLVSGFYNNEHGILKLNKALDSIWFKSFRVDNVSYLIDNSLVETENHLILQGHVQFNNKPKFSVYLIWLDKNGSLDTTMVFDVPDQTGNISFGRVKKDKNDNLVLMYRRSTYDYDGDWSLGYVGFLKLNKDHKIVWQWEDNKKTTASISTDFIITEDQNIIFINHAHTISIKDPLVVCVDTFKNVLWETKLLARSIEDKLVYSIFPVDKDNFLLCGTQYNIFDSISSNHFQGYVSKMNIKGDVLWERTFKRYLGADKTTPTLPTRYFTGSGYFLKVLSDKNKNIFLFGGETQGNNFEPLVYAGWLVKLDSFGCIHKDRCNEVNETERIDFIRFYDQVSILQKKLIYGSKNQNGVWQRYTQSFGKDTFAFDQRYGAFLFREVWYENMDTREKIKDHRRTRWWDSEGRMSFATKNNPHPLHLLWTFQDLYDFTLEVGDHFELPDSFGMATVIATDTFYLKDGAARKRITLRHDDETFHQTHGDLVWVEGIGNINGSFFYQDDWKSGHNTELLCYFDRDQKRYYSPNSVDCFLSATNEETKDVFLFIFPNPTNHCVSFISDHDMSKIEISDMTGRVLFSNILPDGKVDVSNLTVGVYLLYFYTQTGRIITKKLIKL